MAKAIEVDRNEHIYALVERLDELRMNTSHCSLRIRADGKEIYAQRDILIAASRFFEALFSKDTDFRGDKIIEIEDADPECVQICVDFIYGRQVSCLPEKYAELMFVAHLMQLWKLTDALETLMVDYVNPDTFLEMRDVSDTYRLKKLKAECVNFAVENYPVVSKDAEFFAIDKAFLVEFMKSEKTGLSEKEKLDVLLKWIKYDEEYRLVELVEMMKLIGLEEISSSHRRLLLEEEPLIHDNNECLHLMNISSVVSGKVNSGSPRAEKIVIFDINFRHLRLFAPNLGVVFETNLQKFAITQEYSVASTNDHIYILGENGSFHRIKHWDKDAKWERLPDMLTSHGATPLSAIVGGALYVIGGCNGGVYSKEIERYDIENYFWEVLPQRKKPNNGAAVCGQEDCNIYILGGRVNELYMNESFRFDTKTKQWIPIPPMIVKRGYAAATTWESLIVVAGGHNDEGSIQSVEHYCPASGQWTLIAPMIYPRWSLRIFGTTAGLFAVGGMNSKLSRSTIEKYDAENRVWKKIELVSPELTIYDSLPARCDNMGQKDGNFGITALAVTD